MPGLSSTTSGTEPPTFAVPHIGMQCHLNSFILFLCRAVLRARSPFRVRSSFCHVCARDDSDFSCDVGALFRVPPVAPRFTLEDPAAGRHLPVGPARDRLRPLDIPSVWLYLFAPGCTLHRSRC